MRNKEVSLVLLTLLTIVFLSSFINASNPTIQSLADIKAGECALLRQTCSNCSWVNISSISYPNSTISLSEVEMIKNGITFTYNYCDTEALGTYQICGWSDSVGNPPFCYSLLVTPTGKEFALGDILTYIFFLLVCLAILIFSFKLTMNNSMAEDQLTSSQMYDLKRKNEVKFYLQLLKKKMWIIGMFGIYLSLFMFLVFLAQLVFNLGLTDLSEINSTIMVFGWLSIPFTLFWIVYVVIYFFRSSTEIMKHQFGGLNWRSKE